MSQPRHMKINFTLLFYTLLISFTAQAQGWYAFPGAEGAGRYTTGGRGTATSPTTVFEVTRLDDPNPTVPGTLRYAVTTSSSIAPYRTIIFRVSGTIRLTSPLSINRANTTIAGQTAPGDGICIADYPVSISADNLIIRHIRFRLGDRYQASRAGNDDALSGTGRKNIIIDHCTMSWSNDEAFTVYGGDSTTLQWNMMYEPLDYSYHDEGTGIQNHGYGGIWGGRRASLHHNLVAHVRGRAPRFDGNRNVPQENADFRNNVIYNWADYNVNGGEQGNYNVINNFYKWGPSTPNNSTRGVNRRSMVINPYAPYGKFYLAGNHVDSFQNVTARNWLGAAMNSGNLADTNQAKVDTPFEISLMTTNHTALEAYETVLAGAGATLPRRDTLDQRVANDVRNRTGGIIDVQGGYPRGTPFSTTQSAWPTLNSLPAPTDTDKDGMPDEWETRRGLNPNNAADRMNIPNGSTSLENYLNGDTIVALGVNNTCIAGRQIYTNGGSPLWRNSADTNYAQVIATDSLNLIASILNNVSFGLINVSYYTTNTIRYIGAIPYLGRNVTIEALNPSAITVVATVRLYISQQEFATLQAADNTITSVADLRVVRTAGNSCATALTAPYDVITPSATGVFGSYSNGYYIEFQTPAFSTFFIAGPSIALPLQLLSFTGQYNGENVTLRWNTENEVNTALFAIERSANGRDFSEIGTVEAAGNALQKTYSFTDNIPLATTTYYRLKMMDKDGKFTYSTVVHFTPGRLTRLMLSPNPSRSIVVLQHPNARNRAKIIVVDINGKMVMEQNVDRGSLQSSLSVAGLSAGSYLVIYENEGERLTTKLVKE